MSVSDSKQSWKTCFDDMPGETKLLPLPQKMNTEKCHKNYFCFCHINPFRGTYPLLQVLQIHSPTSNANSAQLGAETASLELPRSCSLKREKLLFCHCGIFLTRVSPC